jgi:hypothetical protein
MAEQNIERSVLDHGNHHVQSRHCQPDGRRKPIFRHAEQRIQRTTLAGDLIHNQRMFGVMPIGCCCISSSWVQTKTPPSRQEQRRHLGRTINNQVRVFTPLERRLAMVVSTAAMMMTAPVEACT